MLVASSLGGDLAVVLDVDVLVGGERVDLVLGERGAGMRQLHFWERYKLSGRWVRDEETYVKPGTSLNSCSILPPWSVQCFLALWYVSGDSRGKAKSNLLLQLVLAGTILEGDLVRLVCMTTNSYHVLNRTLI